MAAAPREHREVAGGLDSLAREMYARILRKFHSSWLNCMILSTATRLGGGFHYFPVVLRGRAYHFG